MIAEVDYYLLHKFNDYITEYVKRPHIMDRKLYDELSSSSLKFKFHGPSGSGKTALLQAIEGNENFLETEPTIYHDQDFNTVANVSLNGMTCLNANCTFEKCTHPLIIYQREYWQQQGRPAWENIVFSSNEENIPPEPTFAEGNWFDMIAYNDLWFHITHGNRAFYNPVYEAQIYGLLFGSDKYVHIFLTCLDEETIRNNIRKMSSNQALCEPNLIQHLTDIFFVMRMEANFKYSYRYDLFSKDEYILTNELMNVSL